MNKLKYIKREELDLVKYDAIITNAINTRIYAYSWYLDIVTDHWDALVLGDYEAVMPIPWRMKYFIKYIYIPVWVQQLGVFSNQNHLIENTSIFIDHIPKIFKKITYQFNDLNTVNEETKTKRNNFIIHLNKPYEEHFKMYSRLRKRNLKNDLTKGIEVLEATDIEAIIIHYKNYIQPITLLNNHDLFLLKKTISHAIGLNKVLIIHAVKGEVFYSGAVFFISDARIYSIFSANSPEGKTLNTMTLLKDYIIKKYAQTNFVFDFEGSVNTGIKQFFKSFGSVDKPYVLWEKPFNWRSFF